MNDILQFFPFGEPRKKQELALKFIQKSVENGFKDIVVSAPTGIGKSAIGICSAFWINSHFVEDTSTKPEEEKTQRGAYYLVTQKLLQDQITNDIPRFKPGCSSCASIKSAEEYECPDYGNCSAGRRVSQIVAAVEEKSKKAKSKICQCVKSGECAYSIAKGIWSSSVLSVTNYAYLFTAKMYGGTRAVRNRQMLICDETHSLEEQIIRYVDGSVSLSNVKKWTDLTEIPNLDSIDTYIHWVKNELIPRLKLTYEQLEDIMIMSDDPKKESKELFDLDRYICKLNRCISRLELSQDNWVFWKEESADSLESQYVIRPVFGGPFMPELVSGISSVRLYMSAYPGDKEVFCRNLSLDPETVAWANLNSDFKVDNRRIHFFSIGKMGRNNRVETLPRMLNAVSRIAAKHSDSRGIIHCQSYDLGKMILDSLSKEGMTDRLIFPKNADERTGAFSAHSSVSNAIIISPSMTEGFDFAGDKARWQILPKCPYPSLGDRQIAKKMELDPEWYQMRTLMTVIQACGRICRSHDDFGITYILDSDFMSLWNRVEYMIPAWFKEAVVFH